MGVFAFSNHTPIHIDQSVVHKDLLMRKEYEMAYPNQPNIMTGTYFGGRSRGRFVVRIAPTYRTRKRWVFLELASPGVVGLFEPNGAPTGEAVQGNEMWEDFLPVLEIIYIKLASKWILLLI